MLYITLLDQFHPGIYSSQVIDVCDFLNEKHKANIRVLAFLSIKELRRTEAKKKLKELSPTAIVLPSFPGLKNFQLTSVLLFLVCLFTGERIAICRNVFCTRMALKVKKLGLLKKIVMDGRSAMTAEISEYDVFPVDYLRKNVKAFEADAVINSDFRIAVSQKLINYWERKFEYKARNHVVIPCTLDRKYFGNTVFSFSEQVDKLRSEMGFGRQDVVLVYAGSAAPWQSFELLEKLLSPILEKDQRFKILFLSKVTEDNKRMQSKFPGRVVIKWVEHKDVLPHLQCCDYGILVREQSDTNKVASPTKFAEYLYAGLKVFISENLGDFSTFVIEHDCGYVINEIEYEWAAIKNVDLETKKRCFELSKTYFKKEAQINNDQYSKLMQFLNT